MSDGTKIEWTDATWNVVNGCSVVSPGCKRCYAMKQAHRFPVRQGLTQRTAGGMVWTGEVRFNEAVLTQPLRWKRPRKIFVCAHGDLFHEKVPDEWIDRVFAVMALARQHTFQVLTKRPERMRDYLQSPDSRVRIAKLLNELKPNALWNGNVYQGWQDIHGKGYLVNVWLGTSVEDQQRADERVPILLDTPAAKRWLSMEPLLGPVDIEPWLPWPDGAELPNGDSFGCQECEWETGPRCRCPRDKAHYRFDEGPADENGCPEWVTQHREALDWIVLGGESGPGARPMHPDWARAVRDQCAASGVPFLFKQWGDWTTGVNAGSTIGRRSVDTADWFENRWSFETIDGDFDFHADDEPLLYRTGKKAAGRLLDGVQHDGYPA